MPRRISLQCVYVRAQVLNRGQTQLCTLVVVLKARPWRRRLRESDYKGLGANTCHLPSSSYYHARSPLSVANVPHIGDPSVRLVSRLIRGWLYFTFRLNSSLKNGASSGLLPLIACPRVCGGTHISFIEEKTLECHLHSSTCCLLCSCRSTQLLSSAYLVCGNVHRHERHDMNQEVQ